MDSETILAQETEKAEKKRGGLSKTAINFWVDASLLITFSALVWVTVVVRYVFPPAAVATGWSLWGLTLDDWIATQFNVLAVFSLIVLLHVMLHWSWVCGVIARWRGQKGKVDEGVQTLLGVGTLIVLLNIVGALIAAAWLSVEAPNL